jgi:ketosteroid isomerase-like protein
MIDRAWAEEFAREWRANWNARDLDRVLSHYAPNVVFRSPRIAVALGNDRAFVSGLTELRDYWRKALDAASELHFEVSGLFVGSDALTILYRNHRNQEVAETLVFGEDGKVIEGIVTAR